MDNKIMKFQLESKDVKVKELLSGDFLELELYGISDANPNVNGSHFTIDSMTAGIPSMYNKPVLGYFNPARGPYGDFEGHNDNGLHYDKDLEMAYYDYNSSSSEKILGIIRESDKIGMEKDPATGLTWVKFTCCLWCAYAHKAVKSLLKSRGGKSAVSVEIEVLDSTYDEKGIEHINKFRFLGVTILGQKVRPGIEGANLSVRNFAEDRNLLETHKYLKFAYSALDEYNKSQIHESLDNSQDSNIINSSDHREEYVKNAKEGGNDIPMNESKDEKIVTESFEAEGYACTKCEKGPCDEKAAEACGKCESESCGKCEAEACTKCETEACGKCEAESCGKCEAEACTKCEADPEDQKEAEACTKCAAEEGDDSKATDNTDNKEEEACGKCEAEACGKCESEACGKCEAEACTKCETEACGKCEAEACTKCEEQPCDNKEDEACGKCEAEACGKCEAEACGKFVSNVEVNGESLDINALLEKYNELEAKYSELKESVRLQEVQGLVDFATDLVNAECGIPEDTKIEFVNQLAEKCKSYELADEEGIKKCARTMFALYFYDHREEMAEAKVPEKETKEFSIQMENAPQVEKKASKMSKLQDAMAKLNKIN